MRWLCVSIFTIVLSACGRTEAPKESATPPPAPEREPSSAPAQSAIAQLAPTQGAMANGSLALSGSPEGVRITGTIQGLNPDGEFGFHIHEKGDCSAPDASSAGGHFNPGGQPHGNPAGPTHHAGDMANIHSDSQGVANVETTVTGVTLSTGRPDDVLGKAIVVHERADDYQSQPAGDSGGRIACGVIAIAAQSPPAGPPPG